MANEPIGTIASIWRYPVKSMQGEELQAAAITEGGVLGDRAYAIQEIATGYIANAKHPHKWRTLLDCRARYTRPPDVDQPLPPVAITLPDGSVVQSDDPACDELLSRVLGQPVRLISSAPTQMRREANRTPVDLLASDEVLTQEPMALAAPPGSFFDYAAIHVVASTTLAHLHRLYPDGQFAVQRFRPNIVVNPRAPTSGFIENEWLGRKLRINDTTLLEVIDPCPRCVVTTLAQGQLPADTQILRTISQHNAVASVTLAPGTVFSAVVGVYVAVRQTGGVQQGDAVYY